MKLCCKNIKPVGKVKFSDKKFIIGKFYDVEEIRGRKNVEYFVYDENGDTKMFINNDSTIYISKLYDYFYTESEYRELQLNKLL